MNSTLFSDALAKPQVMKKKKPNDVTEYKVWLSTDHKVEINAKTSAYYDSVVSKMRQSLEASNFWTRMKNEFKEIDARYRLQYQDYPLWVSVEFPKLVLKPFDSFLLKTFRKNVLENWNWPDSPKRGWVLPNNWFSEVNDLVRTTFVVKYLDGVDFLVETMQKVGVECKLESEPVLEARWEGYYAAHFYVFMDFEVPEINWDTKVIRTSAEIQITTQLQEVIRQLTRKYYDQRRRRLKPPDTKWQWDYKSEEFVPNYLGHILHYLEGMIMEVREKQRSDSQ